MSKFVSVVLSILVCGGGLFAIGLISQNGAPSPLDCLTSVEPDMSPQELSQTLDIPLVTLLSVPDFIVDEPHVEMYVWYPLETPDCGLRIKYFADDDPTNPFIEIIVRNPHSIDTDRIDWSCFNYEFESMPVAELQSRCSNYLDASGRRVFVSVATRYDSSATMELIEEFDLQVEFS